jgi:hypothetical protein
VARAAGAEVELLGDGDHSARGSIRQHWSDTPSAPGARPSATVPCPSPIFMAVATMLARPPGLAKMRSRSYCREHRWSCAAPRGSRGSGDPRP